MGMDVNRFLLRRAAQCENQGDNYRHLHTLLQRMNLVVLSGATTVLTTIEEAGFTGEPTHWPKYAHDHDEGILEIQTPRKEFLMRLRVGEICYTGIAFGGESSTTWNIDDLREVLKRAVYLVEQTRRGEDARTEDSTTG